VNFTHRAAFNYGLSTTYGTEISVTEWQSPSECPALVSKTIKHLKPGTTYHWQLEDIFSSWYNEIYRCGELGLGECSQRTAANTHYHGPDQTVTTAVVSAPRTGTVSTEQIGLSGISCALKSGCQGSLSVSVPTRTCQRSPLGCDVPSSVSKLCTSAATCQVKGATASAAEQGLVLANGRFTVPAKKHARAVLRLTKAGRDFFKSGKFFKDRKKTSVLLAIAAGGPHKRRIKTTSPLSLRRGGPG
jgi:hypothetical protein